MGFGRGYGLFWPCVWWFACEIGVGLNGLVVLVMGFGRGYGW